MAWRKSVVGAGLLIVFGTVHGSLQAAPRGSKIVAISYGGSGCSQGSLDLPNLSGWKTIPLKFADFAAEIGAGVPRTESRKFCQLTFVVNVPRGWSYALRRVNVGGHADLSTRTSASIQFNTYFSSAEDSTFSTILRGEYDDTYLIRDELGSTMLAWSPCNTNKLFNIKLDATLSASGSASHGTLSLDSWNISPTDFVWRRCE